MGDAIVTLLFILCLAWLFASCHAETDHWTKFGGAVHETDGYIYQYRTNLDDGVIDRRVVQ